jgi:hypothetical protein
MREFSSAMGLRTALEFIGFFTYVYDAMQGLNLFIGTRV